MTEATENVPSTPPTPQERNERFQTALQTLLTEHKVKIVTKTFCILPGGRIEAAISGVEAVTTLILE